MSSSAFSRAQSDDTSASLRSLRHQTGVPLLHSVIDIYKSYSRSNEKSIQFWEELRCFSPQESIAERRVYDHGTSDQVLLKLHSPENGYVALSYPWEPSNGESDKKEKYRLASNMEERLKVRDTVLDRTFHFIRYKQANGVMLPLWVDQLSIGQEDKAQKELAMQSMDLVYKKCTYAVGYLWTQLQTQTEMNRLSDLLSGRIVERKLAEGHPVLVKKIKHKVLREVLDVLTRITDDVWWTRAWIFQEDYLAGRNMWLLIRHASGLKKPLAHNKLGSLRGEVVVNSYELKTYATLFCLACCYTMGQSSKLAEQCMEVLKKAGKYNVLYKHQYAKEAQRSMSVRIFKDLDRRGISHRSDLLPIGANVCGYDVRFATKEVGFERKSLSMSILALSIANGELFANLRGADELRHNVFNFLKENSLRICAPLPDGELTLIKHCRLSVDDLSPAGIHTKGVLWRLGDIVSPQATSEGTHATTKRPYQRDLFRYGLDDYQRDRLANLLEVLKKRRRYSKRRYQSITNDLQTYLESNRSSPKHDDWPPQHSMNAMASAIVDAMDTGKYLQLARPLGGSLNSGRGVSYRAILIRDRDDLQIAGSKYVFTSWNRTNKRLDGKMESRRIAKYVSLEVGVHKDVRDGPGRLDIKKWVNGLCFFEGEKKFPFIFDWPHSLFQ
ncbi:hypothetical protein IQ07DRAFT_628797 [Pyrenochaeta sp. DS3sAY3a]|nr:hypothetical protein IQ07DRAFT_628797 [Pyrenochaeta sp. DS3sAY3a]